MERIMDKEFNRIARKEINSLIATAFISLDYETRLLDEQTKKKVFEKKANQFKADVAALADSIVEKIVGEKINKDSIKETKYKISVDGAEEYKEEIQEMKNAVIEYRKEIDKLNASMEREIELISRKLKQLREHNSDYKISI